MTIQEAIKLLEEMKENCKAMPFEYRDEKATLKAEAIDTVLAQLKESKKEGKWKPDFNEEYWFRNDEGTIVYCIYNGYVADTWRYNNTPLFKTEEECERYWHFMDTVKEKSYEFNREEWKDWGVEKHYISYDFENECFYVYANDIANDFGVVHFKTEEDAQYIIDNFKEELLKYWL